MRTDAEPKPDDGAIGATIRISKLTLFVSFLKLGATAFGGPAMVAYMRELTVKKKSWLSEASFRDGVALCQTIPGATVMQMAAYVGWRAGGVASAILAYAAFALPAFALMLIFAMLYRHGENMQVVMAMFRGLQVIVIALMANATITFGKSLLRNWPDWLLTAGAAVALGFGINPLLVIGAAALLGLGCYWKQDLLSSESAVPAPKVAWQPLAAAGFLILATALSLIALFQCDRKLFDLSVVMLKVDAAAFGGGYASLPLMLNEVVEVRHWVDDKVVLDGIALGQITPGPIVITATFVGYQVAGLAGAVLSTFAIFTPSLILVLASAPCLDRLQRSRLFRAALRGPLASFTGLLLAATVRLGLNAPWTVTTVIIAGLAFAALRLQINILWVVLVGATASFLLL
ncbi:MAG: chromate efflux transporter [Planctomycetota bacterium]